MKRFWILSICMLGWINGLDTRPNCTLFQGACQDACYEITDYQWYPQGSNGSQAKYDKAIKWCPNFAYAYMQKAVPYLKRGDFITWKQLIDQAVILDPLQHLGYRGWCRLQFLRDYEGAIEDIEALDKLTEGHIGYSQTGQYHLRMALGFCYKKIGQQEKALTIMTQHFAENPHRDPYDYYHLGVLQYEMGLLKEALDNLQIHEAENSPLAENFYYMALIYKAQKEQVLFEQYTQLAITNYQKGNYLTDQYSEPLDKVYLSEILNLTKQ